jgi:hypothetical protein
MSKIELCWECHEPIGDSFVGYLPKHYEILGGGIRNAHEGCVPEGATVVGKVTIDTVDDGS